MRRLSSRRRNKLLLKELDKRAAIAFAILISIILILIAISSYFIMNQIVKNCFEKQALKISSINEDTPFSFKKVVLFSSATVDTNDLKNSVWSLNISQFSDICIYLTNSPNVSEQKNTIKEFYIDNIDITKPELGNSFLYRKSINDFGKCTFKNDSIIDDRLNFEVLNSTTPESSTGNVVSNKLFEPIVVGFYNQNIKENYLSSSSNIDYSGKILKEAKIPKSSLQCNVSFNLNIINELDEHYICNVNFNIPFESDNSSIYDDGYIVQELNNLENYKFLRLK